MFPLYIDVSTVQGDGVRICNRRFNVKVKQQDRVDMFLKFWKCLQQQHQQQWDQDPGEFIQLPRNLSRNVQFNERCPDPVTPMSSNDNRRAQQKAQCWATDLAQQEAALCQELEQLQQQQANMQATNPTQTQQNQPQPTTLQDNQPQRQPTNNPQPKTAPQGLNLPVGLQLDPNMFAMMTWMQAQNEALVRSLTTSQKPTKPQQAFPHWDGKEHTMTNLIEWLKTYKEDPYFAGGDWTHKLPGFEAHSTLHCSKILDKLPAKELFIFQNHPEFDNDGFTMWEGSINVQFPAPSKIKNPILAILDLANLEYVSTTTPDS